MHNIKMNNLQIIHLNVVHGSFRYLNYFTNTAAQHC